MNGSIYREIPYLLKYLFCLLSIRGRDHYHPIKVDYKAEGNEKTPSPRKDKMARKKQNKGRKGCSCDRFLAQYSIQDNGGIK